MLNKKLVEELMSVKGEARGIVLKTDADFVRRKKGEIGLEKVEKALREISYPIDYKNIDALNFYPIGLRILSLLAIKQALDFSDEDIAQMGAEAPKISLVIKLFAKFFFSLSATVAQAPKMWKKHYTVGELSAKADEEKKQAVVQLRDLTIHPIFCAYLKGYFATIIKMVVNAPVASERVKCPYINKQDKYHEYLMKW